MRKKGNQGVKIGSTYVGHNHPTFFVAEIGINHNGDLSLAKQLIHNAKYAGASAVKFQKRNSKEVFTEKMLHEAYNSPNAYGKTYGEHREALEFSFEQCSELMDYAKGLDILFFSSVWDESSVDFMTSLGVDAFKIASADADNFRLIDKVISTKKPILISTGMSTQSEVESVVSHVSNQTNKFIFFQSTSLYPASVETLNLSFIKTLLKMSKGNPVGYSGHESDLMPSLISVALGASIIERHITLDKKSKGSDHAASLLPSEFKKLVDDSKSLKSMLGSTMKPSLSEDVKKMRRKLGKSLYYASDFESGHRLRVSDLKLLSPGDGVSPMLEIKFVNKKLKRSVKYQEPLKASDFE